MATLCRAATQRHTCVVLALVLLWLLPHGRTSASVGQLGSSPGQTVSGTWTRLANPPPHGAMACLLLTDASVVCKPYSGTFDRLTPDAFGQYVTGTWSSTATMPAGYDPDWFASAVLPDGRLLVEGGEVNQAVTNETNLGAIYDPVANLWTAVSPPSGWTTIGDAPSVVLANGTFLLGNCCNGLAASFNAHTLSWTPVSAPLNDYFGEEGFTLLPHGTVLKLDASGSNSSERFNPLTGLWASAGSTPVRLWDFGSEFGPSILRPDGTVVQFGANASGAGHTGIFDVRTLQWSAGPDFPNGDNASDNPAALLPNGRVLIAAGPGWSNSSNTLPVRFYEFDGVSFTQVAAPGGPYCNGATCV